MNTALRISLLFCFCLFSKGALAEQLKLAVVAPLTGPFATYGEPMARGAKLAEQALKARGQDVKVVMEDACLPADAVRSVKRLVEIEKVDAVVGSYCVIGLAAMLPVLNRDKVPVFHTSVLPESMVEKNKELLFSTNTSIEFEAEYLAKAAYQKLEKRHAAVIYFRSQWGESYSDSFSKHFEALGGKISGIETTFVDDDKSTLRASLLRLSQKKPDLLFIASIGGDSGAIMKQARSLGMKFSFLSVNEIEDKNMMDAAGPAAEGLIYAAHAPGENSKYAEFSKQYLKAHNESAHPLARHAYDATILAASCNGTTKCLQRKLEEELSGASGAFQLGKQQISQRALILKTVKNGKFTQFP